VEIDDENNLYRLVRKNAHTQSTRGGTPQEARFQTSF